MTLALGEQIERMPHWLARLGPLAEDWSGVRERRRGASPRLSFGRHDGPPRADARRAAVLILLYPAGAEWRVLLTRRQPHLNAHGGQVSFPGGTLESGESAQAAAWREGQEELGVAAELFFPLGRLAPLYLFNSNFWVAPWLAWMERRPDLVPQTDEVAEIVELPLAQLCHSVGQESLSVERGGLRFSAPALHVQGATVWGATHVLLAELARLLAEAGFPE